MHTDADRTHDQTLRLTVPDAAKALGISAEAVRARIKRGTLDIEKDADGSVHVLVDAALTRQDGDGTGDLTTAQALIIARLENEVGFLRSELERKDAILLNMTEGLKSLEAPSEGPGSSPLYPRTRRSPHSGVGSSGLGISEGPQKPAKKAGLLSAPNKTAARVDEEAVWFRGGSEP
jgi:hypothetical protein